MEGEKKKKKHIFSHQFTHHQGKIEEARISHFISHTSKGEVVLDLFCPAAFSYASEVDLLRNRKDSLLPHLTKSEVASMERK